MNGLNLGIGMSVPGQTQTPVVKALGIGRPQTPQPDDEEERRRRIIEQQAQRISSTLSPVGLALFNPVM